MHCAEPRRQYQGPPHLSHFSFHLSPPPLTITSPCHAMQCHPDAGMPAPRVHCDMSRRSLQSFTERMNTHAFMSATYCQNKTSFPQLHHLQFLAKGLARLNVTHRCYLLRASRHTTRACHSHKWPSTSSRTIKCICNRIEIMERSSWPFFSSSLVLDHVCHSIKPNHLHRNNASGTNARTHACIICVHLCAGVPLP